VLPYMIDMGLLQLVGSVKLRVSLAEYCLFYRALLQKRPIIFFDPTNQSHPIEAFSAGAADCG